MTRTLVKALYQSLVALAVLAGAIPVSAQPNLEFQQLPKEIRDRAITVRGSCKELNAEMKFNDMQGITVIDLKGDGSKDIVVDNEGLCGEHMAGANCSNRGCDLLIYKEVGRGQWRKTFEEHLYEKHLAIDWETIETTADDRINLRGGPKVPTKSEKGIHIWDEL